MKRLRQYLLCKAQRRIILDNPLLDDNDIFILTNFFIDLYNKRSKKINIKVEFVPKEVVE